jgi:hypothetical protein
MISIGETELSVGTLLCTTQQLYHYIEIKFYLFATF